MRTSIGIGIIVTLILTLSISLVLGACDTGDNKTIDPPMARPAGESPQTSQATAEGPTENTGETKNAEKRVITIGNLTDKTGVSANAMTVIDTALQDLVRYYNDNNLIPGIELEVIEYDGQWDPSKDVPGYEWLRGKGADLIYTCQTFTPITLMPRVNADRVPLYAAAVDIKKLTTPGYVFCMGIIPQQEVYTLLPWIAENDWDYKAKGPAKIGGVGWPDTYCPSFFEATERYAKAHPDQFEYTGGYLTNYSFVWGHEVEKLMDSDYVFPNSIMTSFVREYRDTGGKAKFIGTDVVAAFMSMVDEVGLWDEMDGALYIRSSQWWNEQGKLIDLTNQILRQYRPGEADEITRGGSGYLAVNNAYLVLECIKATVEAVGPENFTSEALYQATQQISVEFGGVKHYSYTDSKRTAVDSLAIYRMDGEKADIFRVDDQWLPVRYEP